MTNLAVRDADSLVRYLSMTGTGASGDPFVPQQQIIRSPASSFITAQVLIATAGVVTQLPAYAVQRGILLKALSSNNGSVFVGDATVTATTGFELDKSEAVLLQIDELSKLYIVTTAANEGVSLIGI